MKSYNHSIKRVLRHWERLDLCFQEAASGGGATGLGPGGREGLWGNWGNGVKAVSVGVAQEADSDWGGGATLASVLSTPQGGCPDFRGLWGALPSDLGRLCFIVYELDHKRT